MSIVVQMATGTLNLVQWLGYYLQHLILEAHPQEKVGDFRFCDGHGEERNLIQGFGLPVLDQEPSLALISPPQ